jgi:hypothetical protein
MAISKRMRKAKAPLYLYKNGKLKRIDVYVDLGSGVVVSNSKSALKDGIKVVKDFEKGGNKLS